MPIHDDLCDLIGNTPIFPLPRLSAALGDGVELLAKAEHLNPGGSIKDRVALGMIRAAEDDGRLGPGMTVTEATAGNTGLGLAWICAARGYRFVAVMSASDKGPKTEVMESMGAECVLVEPGPAWDSEDGCLGIAGRIAAERGGVFLNQFENPANPQAHACTTAAEILAQTGGRVDAVVIGVGTGGTAAGLGRVLKPAVPGLRLIGVAAEGSYLGSELEGDRIAGITPDFAPKIFDEGVLDAVVTVTAADAAPATMRLAREEGIPAGLSSGALLLAAEAEAKRLRGERPGRTARVLFTICDGVRNYPSLLT
ncbi:MAG: cysteine synthase family protein [Acidobacteriota bacterium]